MRNLLLFIVFTLGLSACGCHAPFSRCNFNCTYVESDSTNSVTCSACSKADIEELEDAGWECGRGHK